MRNTKAKAVAVAPPRLRPLASRLRLGVRVRSWAKHLHQGYGLMEAPMPMVKVRVTG